MIYTDIKRSPLIPIVNLLQLLLGLLLAALTIYLLALTRSADTLSDPDAAGTAHGLLIGAAVLGIPAIVTLIGAGGLRKRKFWGWALSLATDVGMVAVLVYSVFDESNWESEETALAAMFAAPIVLLLLPTVRKYYWYAMAGTKVSS